MYSDELSDVENNFLLIKAIQFYNNAQLSKLLNQKSTTAKLYI